MNIRFAACGSNGIYPNLIDDQQRHALQPVKLLIEPTAALSVGQQRDPLGRGPEQDAVPGQAGADPQGDREMCLAGAAWGNY
jgi:hypothetical protein